MIFLALLKFYCRAVVKSTSAYSLNQNKYVDQNKREKVGQSKLRFPQEKRFHWQPQFISNSKTLATVARLIIAMNFPYTTTCSPNIGTCRTGKSNIVFFVTRWIFFVRGTCSYNFCNRAALKISEECHKKILWHASFTKAVCCRSVILIKKRLNHELERVRKSISQNRSERLLLPYQSEYCEIL